MTEQQKLRNKIISLDVEQWFDRTEQKSPAAAAAIAEIREQKEHFDKDREEIYALYRGKWVGYQCGHRFIAENETLLDQKMRLKNPTARSYCEEV